MEDISKYFKDYSILCVEDEEGIRKRLVNTLKYYFEDVYEASDGEEGFEVYMEYKPDIVISDIEMSGKNGIELVNNIRNKDKDTIIIVLTAFSNEDYLIKLINLNINHYILKPINSENLFEALNKVISPKLNKKFIIKENCIFDIKNRELYYKDEVVFLRKRDKDFLLLLYENKNRLVTYDMIENSLWRDKNMSMSALKTFIKEFRQRFPFEILENVPQEGYKFIV